MFIKVTARTKRGHAIISVVMDAEEATIEEVFNHISDQLTQNESRRVLLDKWIEGGRKLTFREV